MEKKSRLLAKMHTRYTLLKELSFKDLTDFEKLRLFFKVKPYTMLPYQRLSNVYELSQTIERHKIEGSFVECGVWRGGCAAVMAYVAHKAGNNRTVHLFDSFEGLPEPIEKDGIEAKIYAENKVGGRLHSIGKCVASREDVAYVLFTLLKLKRENIVVHQGWFQDTVPSTRGTIGPIAILRLDCDWYESVKICLDYLYDNVTRGGFVIIDDYNSWEGCKRAVDEFLHNKELKVKMRIIDSYAVYFQKP